MIDISLTEFVDFVNKSGSPKFNTVKSIKKNRENEYSPASDYYKQFREGIKEFHTQNLDKDILDSIANSVHIDRKDNYELIINGYKKFLGRKQYRWLSPPNMKKWNVGDLSIRINPELGLEYKNNFYIIKLYLKEEKLEKRKIDSILTLMEHQLRDEVEVSEVQFAVLDTRNGKLHIKKDSDCPLIPLLEGEAHCFSTIWNNLE